MLLGLTHAYCMVANKFERSVKEALVGMWELTQDLISYYIQQYKRGSKDISSPRHRG